MITRPTTTNTTIETKNRMNSVTISRGGGPIIPNPHATHTRTNAASNRISANPIRIRYIRDRSFRSTRDPY